MKITKENIQEIYTRYGVSAERAKHSFGVAKIAQDLAGIHGVDSEKAWLAGALHDIARDWADTKLTEYTFSHQLKMSEEERNFPPLLHGRIAADLAKNELDVKDPEVLSAIRHHTSGKADMSTLETILSLADFHESTAEMPKYQNIRDELTISLPKTVNLVNQATKKRVEGQGYKLSNDFLENIDFYSKYQ